MAYIFRVRDRHKILGIVGIPERGSNVQRRGHISDHIHRVIGVQRERRRTGVFK